MKNPNKNQWVLIAVAICLLAFGLFLRMHPKVTPKPIPTPVDTSDYQPDTNGTGKRQDSIIKVITHKDTTAKPIDTPYHNVPVVIVTPKVTYGNTVPDCPSRPLCKIDTGENYYEVRLGAGN